jgi:UDP-2,3-diacylglucosamine pyrophosphatase LpxH
MMEQSPVSNSQDPRQYRTLFLSDIHLGTRGCQAELLLDFLKWHEAETIYLVGDIIDGWRLKGGWYWPQAHNDIVQKLLRKVRKGARMIYVPGNHDEFMRDYIGFNFGGVEVVEHAYHTMADGRRVLVIHGDFFDIVVRHARWLALLGDWAYEVALWSNTWLNKIRRSLGFPYWSLSAWAKLKVKNAVNFIGAFETALVEEAARREVDGVVCGHIHHATIRDINGMLYVNIGDFVESCTVIAEHHDGRLEILRWQVLSEDREVAVPDAAIKAAA